MCGAGAVAVFRAYIGEFQLNINYTFIVHL